MSEKTSFPLCWPENWPRVDPGLRRVSRFKWPLTISEACNFLNQELTRLGRESESTAILSTNLRPTLVGKPDSRQSKPMDCGAAVYFSFRNKQVSLACDKWNTVEHNIWAIAKHIEALRGQERWGVGSIEQAFRGYMAIPERSEASSWWRVLGVAINAAPEQVREAYCRLASQNHPDKGGTNEAMAAINLAYEEAQKAIT